MTPVDFILSYVLVGMGVFWLAAFVVLVFMMPVRVLQKRHGYSLWVLAPCLLPLLFAFSIWVGVPDQAAGSFLVLFLLMTPWVFALSTPETGSEAHI